MKVVNRNLCPDSGHGAVGRVCAVVRVNNCIALILLKIYKENDFSHYETCAISYQKCSTLQLVHLLDLAWQTLPL